MTIVELKHKVVNNQELYFWFLNYTLISPSFGHKTLDEAEQWYARYTGPTPELDVSPEELAELEELNRTYMPKPRPSQVSIMMDFPEEIDERDDSTPDRRQQSRHDDKNARKAGRRWQDQVKQYRK